MKNKIEVFYWAAPEQLNNLTIRELMYDNYIFPILNDQTAADLLGGLSIRARVNQKPLPNTLRLVEFGTEYHYKPYLEEIYSGGIQEFGGEIIRESLATSLLKIYPDMVMGDTNPFKIEKLIQLGCTNVTYTCYSEYWNAWYINWFVRLTGINIRKWWKNQIETWNYLEKKYNVLENPLSPISYKFNYCWISLEQQKDFSELIQWCKNHNKTILLISGFKPTQHLEIADALISFCEIIKDVLK